MYLEDLVDELCKDYQAGKNSLEVFVVGGSRNSELKDAL